MSLSNLWLTLWLISAGPYGPHDLRTAENQDYCGVCHTSHGAKANILLSIAPTGKMQTPSPDVVLDTVSLFCLACHSDGGPVADQISGDKLLGVSLTDDHPVGVDYTRKTRARPTYTPGSHLPRLITLKKGRISCTTCHDPHSKTSGPMLKASPQVLCTSCHRIQTVGAHALLSCTDCHQMHTAWQTSLLKSEPVSFCADCHPFLPESHPKNAWTCETCHLSHKSTGRAILPPIKKTP